MALLIAQEVIQMSNIVERLLGVPNPTAQEAANEILTLRTKVAEQELIGKTLLNIIEFTINPMTEEPIAFLRTWVDGDFECIKREWPEFNFGEGDG